MKKHHWHLVRRNHVLEAIKIFDKENPSYPAAKNKFLMLQKKKYPAKHIRGMSYKIATGFDIAKSEYTGGNETVEFFKKLGFSVQYRLESTSEGKEGNQLKIARLVVRKSHLNSKGDLSQKQAIELLKNFTKSSSGKFDILVTPAAFFKFAFPKSLNHLTISELEYNLSPILSAAEQHIKRALQTSRPLENLREATKFITFGIDGYSLDSDLRIELVSLFDTTKFKTIHWTGKFYPTEDQKKTLIRFRDLSSHFVKLQGVNLAILGCHDLNVFSPRGQKSVKKTSEKGISSSKFQKLFKEFAPEVVIQHPHNTDTPKIWSQSWANLVKQQPVVSQFVSGIKYFNRKGPLRAKLQEVLEKTKLGDITDF